MKESVIVEMTLEEFITSVGRYLKLKKVIGDYSRVRWDNLSDFRAEGSSCKIRLVFYNEEEIAVPKAGLSETLTEPERNLNMG